MKKTVLALALFASLVGPAMAGGPATGGASEWTQLQNMALLGKQIEQMKMQFDQALQQTQSLTRALQNPMDFTGLEQQFSQLNSLVRQASNLSYAAQNIDANFRSRYGGYEDTLVKQMRSSGQVPANYGEQQAVLQRDTMDSIRGALAAAGFQADKMSDEASMLAQLRAKSNSATGQLEAVQAGNQINGFIADELRRSRQLQMSMIQSQSAWQAYQSQKAINDEEKQKVSDEALEKNSRKSVEGAMEKARQAASGFKF